MYNKRLKVYRQGGFKIPNTRKDEEPSVFNQGKCLILP